IGIECPYLVRHRGKKDDVVFLTINHHEAADQQRLCLASPSVTRKRKTEQPLDAAPANGTGSQHRFVHVRTAPRVVERACDDGWDHTCTTFGGPRLYLNGLKLRGRLSAYLYRS